MFRDFQPCTDGGFVLVTDKEDNVLFIQVARKKLHLAIKKKDTYIPKLQFNLSPSIIAHDTDLMFKE